MLSSSCILPPSSPCHGKPHLWRQELFSHLSSAGLCSPMGQQQPTGRRTHRHTKRNTSTVLSSSLMLTEGDSCHSPFPGKAQEGFGHPNLLDPTAKPGYYSRMSQLPQKATRRGDVESRPQHPKASAVCSSLSLETFWLSQHKHMESPHRLLLIQNPSTE